MSLSLDQTYEIVRETFENVAFLDVDSEGEDLPLEEISQIFALRYFRPKEGVFFLLLPKKLKFLIAENIYGEEWRDLSPNQIDDCLLEILNILAGKLLTERFGRETSYRMGLPTILFDESDEDFSSERKDFAFQSREIPFKLTWIEDKA